MRKSLVAGNWKMHGSQSQVQQLLHGIVTGAKTCSDVDIVVLPPFLYLTEAKQLLSHTAVQLGAQNLYLGEQGAFTGEVSGVMLADVGCHYVLVGHSERRSLFHENLTLVAAKYKAALEAGLVPIVCVGESQSQREHGETEGVIAGQLQSIIEVCGVESLRRAVIAYEPVWAIGTGLTATPEQAQDVHAFIRRLIQQKNVDIAETLRILYGGSVKADNAPALFAMPDIDGGLIGGASLDANSFLSICAAASVEKVN